MRPRERRETGEQDLFRSRLDRIIDLTHALVKLRARSIGGFWKHGSDRSIRMAPVARPCRRG
jgi:hypothetical protein